MSLWSKSWRHFSLFLTRASWCVTQPLTKLLNLWNFFGFNSTNLLTLGKAGAYPERGLSYDLGIIPAYLRVLDFGKKIHPSLMFESKVFPYTIGSRPNQHRLLLKLKHTSLVHPPANRWTSTEYWSNDIYWSAPIWLVTTMSLAIAALGVELCLELRLQTLHVEVRLCTVLLAYL